MLPLLGLILWAEDPFAAQRAAMVRSQIEARGIRSVSVLQVMRTVPRHEFVPAGVRLYSYDDNALPIGHGATISQPYIVAIMTELLDVQPNDKVLEIGTGSGYQAAILSRLAKSVYTIEIVPELAREAAPRLARLGFTNVTVQSGDGYLGWPEKAPFDRIMLTAAPVDVPKALIDQLKAGGKLVAPVGARGVQELIVVEKFADGRVRQRSVLPVAFLPMTRK